MNEFYLLKKSTTTIQYQIEKAIYEDLYQYRDCDNITLRMLQSIILNKNKYLLIQVLSQKTLTQSEIVILLETICTEGDEYFDFFEILYKNLQINKSIIILLLEKAIVSNSIKILNILFENHIQIIKQYLTKDFIEKCIEKNPEVTLIQFLFNYIDISLIVTSNVLEDIFNNDNINLFKWYVSYQPTNLNHYLDKAISKNAYDIIDYILSIISNYKIQQKSEYYNDFFDYLISENIDKTICFLDKVDNVYLLGTHNLEKLLLTFESYEDFDFLLFSYSLNNLKFTSEVVQQKIKKFLLNKKLKQKLIIKNSKEIKKI